jgi:hypothetical protein
MTDLNGPALLLALLLHELVVAGRLLERGQAGGRRAFRRARAHPHTSRGDDSGDAADEPADEERAQTLATVRIQRRESMPP